MFALSNFPTTRVKLLNKLYLLTLTRDTLFDVIYRGLIKGRTQGKLTTCEHEFTQLFLTLGLQNNCTC